MAVITQELIAYSCMKALLGAASTKPTCVRCCAKSEAAEPTYSEMVELLRCAHAAEKAVIMRKSLLLIYRSQSAWSV